MKDLLLIKEGSKHSVKKFLTSLLEPLQTMTDNMKSFETQELKRARWNGQKIVLQAALNDIFGITSAPFIYIETNQDIARNTYVYEPSELSPVYFSEPSENDPIFLFEPGELPTEDYDFTVFIPSGIYTAALEAQVIAQVKLYKLAGPNFTIDTY